MRLPRRSFTTDAHGQILAADAERRGAGRTQLQRQAVAGVLLRPYRGVYLVPDAADAYSQLRAALAHVGPQAVAVAGSAAIVHGLAGLPQDWTPQVALPPGRERRQRRGIDLHTWDLPPRHIANVEIAPGEAFPATTLLRTLADTCRILSTTHAVCLVDSALDRGAIDVSAFPAILNLMARRRDCVRGRRALELARPGAQSPGETRTRLILTAAGLPPDGLQMPIHSSDRRLLGYGDLGYVLPEGGRLIVEFDGRSVHELPEALLRDRRRQNDFQARGEISIFRFTWEDTNSPHTIPNTIGPVLRAAGWRPHRAPRL